MSERAGPDGADLEKCLVGEHDEDAAEGWDPFDQSEEGVQLDSRKAFAADGMPSEVAPVNESDIPKFDLDTLICTEDASEFVWRDQWGEILADFPANEAERSPSGVWRVQAASVAARLDDVESLRDRTWMAGTNRRPTCYGGWLEVEPIRPRCRHYLRQCTQMRENASLKFVYRLCSLRRSTEGAMMGVWDRGLWACDWREPRHLPSEQQWLDEFDRKLMEAGRRRKYLPMFEAISHPAVGIELG